MSAHHELWLPVLRPHERGRLMRIHEELAREWTRVLGSHLLPEARFTFTTLGFETFAALADGDTDNSRIAAFMLDRDQVAGFLLVSSAAIVYLVDARLGAVDGTAAESGRILTRLENALAREALEHLLATLSRVYTTAGLGWPKPTRFGERLRNTLLFAPEVYLLTFRFHIESPGIAGLDLTIAAAIDLVNPLRDLIATSRPPSANLQQAVAELPCEVELELGAWDVTVAELAALHPGDAAILPDGQDAWLCAAGVPVKRVRVSLAGGKLLIVPKERRHAS